MKLKNILLLSVIAAITCCVMTSCEKPRRTCEISFVNTTTNYGLQLYMNGAARYSETNRLWPGQSENYTAMENPNLTYWCVDSPVDIKIEWYKMTGNQTFNKTPDHEFTQKNYRFDYDHKYKVIVVDKTFTIQRVQ